MADQITFTLNGREVEVEPGGSLLDALRESLGVHSVKDGCSPQGQCGCCTVWVDGQPRVSCVTPVGRVAGREVTTVEALDEAERWAQTFSACGASQCGFCTPGIIMRLAALDPDRRQSPDAVRQSMLAHMCRCTGWQTIVEASIEFDSHHRPVAAPPTASTQRARIEGGVEQMVGPQVALGAGGFADDTAPPDALVALRRPDGEWVVGETLSDARILSGKVQGRRTTAPLTWPLDLPEGDWARTLRTTWVEPAYLEPDASWCLPGGEPASSRGNGGAFGGKSSESLGTVARRLADEHGRAVRALATREDVVRLGPKRPPIAAGVAAGGTGVVHVVRTTGIVEAIHSVAPQFEVVEFDVTGPATSSALRGAGWVEAAVLLASLSTSSVFEVAAPSGGRATAEIVDVDGVETVRVSVEAGNTLDRVVLRSYCIGAAHMALGWVRSEGLALGPNGEPADLTIRSFGVLRAVDTPAIEIEIVESDGPAVNASDAVFASVAAAAWAADGWSQRWPTRAT